MLYRSPVTLLANSRVRGKGLWMWMKTPQTRGNRCLAWFPFLWIRTSVLGDHSCAPEGTFSDVNSTITLFALGDSQSNWHSQGICFITVKRPGPRSCQSDSVLLECLQCQPFPRQAAISTLLCPWRQLTVKSHLNLNSNCFDWVLSPQTSQFRRI
jgi:hypothetical protein